MKRTVAVLILLITLLLTWTSAFAQPIGQTQGTGPGRFSDISGHWAEFAVKTLTEKNAIPFGGDKFVPGKAVTRSEFAVMLHAALGIQIMYFKAPDIKDYFTDVKQDAPYASALIDLVTANILKGKGSFRPDAILSREEMAHYIMNAYKYMMGESYKAIKIYPSTFKDKSRINPLYAGDVAMAEYLKLIVGTGGKFLHPKDSTTRAQAAVVIKKLMNLLEKENASKNINPEITIKPAVTTNDDSIEMKLSVTNNSKNAVTLTHSSGQKYDFALLDSEKKDLYRWSADKSFIVMETTTVIEAGKSIEFTETLSGDQHKAIKDKIAYLRAYLIGSFDSFAIDSEGYEIKIER